jgi:hypothetical protein
MNEKELRVGNLVGIEDIDTQIIVTINGIKQGFIDEPYDIEVKFKDGMYSDVHLEDLEPVKLTEERIVLLKFVKRNGYSFEMLNGFLKEFEGDFYFTYYNLSIKCEYVHQLQNLYFALTGKELIVS